MRTGAYFVYILSSRAKVLYVGVTNDLERRVWQHKNHAIAGFTSSYNVTRLVYFEDTNDVREAIARERDKGLAAREESGAD
jgi:putative endonuclease